MIKFLEIKPDIGLGDFVFGDTIDVIKSALGEPDDTEILNDEDFETKIITYFEEGITFFFEGEDNSIFTCVEIDNEDALIFGKKIIGKNEKEIIGLMSDHGYTEYETDVEEWGEKRISYEKNAIDFFFQDDELISVSWASLDLNLGGDI